MKVFIVSEVQYDWSRVIYVFHKEQDAIKKVKEMKKAKNKPMMVINYTYKEFIVE